MIFASSENVREWTEKRIWGTKTLIDYFKENVAKTPERIEIIAAIPRNPVGKILKSVLREDIRKKLSSS